MIYPGDDADPEDFMAWCEQVWERHRTLVHDFGCSKASSEYEKVRKLRINAIRHSDWELVSEYEQALIQIGHEAEARRRQLN